MKIIHSSGKELKLKPGTVLEMERTNPFFNNFGEQSLPVKLPPDEHNRTILGFPDDMAGVNKMPSRSDATIQEGIFSIRCRQAILSASLKDGIETSFYLNAGSFYEKMKDVGLKTVFKDKVIKFSSLTTAISFVRGLMITPDPRFSCFPALAESHDNGEIVCLNRVSGPIKPDGYLSLWNEQYREETVDENTISTPAGYYISPFIKAMHLLDEIFKYLGYTLEDSFFSKTEPFKSMVFLNNNIDTIVNSEIRYDQVVPNCNISTILDIFRYKFCCEFIPDETARTVRIVLFNEIADSNARQDLTTLLTSPISVNHGSKYKQIKLSADKGAELSYNDEGKWVSTTPDYLSKSLYEIAAMYPEAFIDLTRGWIIRDGFTPTDRVLERVGTLNCDYYASGTLETEKKESPDTLVSIETASEASGVAPYIGTSRALNSKIVPDNAPTQGNKTDNSTQKKSELKPMLCFTAHRTSRNDSGTIYAYLDTRERMWNYSLAYNGPDGLFEKFWRKYDDMLRNSMRPVTTKMLLKDIDKLNISAHEKVVINNQELLPNVIKYNVGKNVDTECTFLTTKLYNPVSSAKSESTHFPSSKYQWRQRWRKSVDDRYNWMQLKEKPATLFLPPPTEAEYSRGGRFHEKSYPCWFAVQIELIGKPVLVDKISGALTTWLEPILRDW